MFNPDRVSNADEGEVANAAMTVIDALQVRFTSEVQMLGLSAAFLLMAQRHKQHPGDLFLTINNIMNGVEGKRAEFKALEMYMENET